MLIRILFILPLLVLAAGMRPVACRAEDAGGGNIETATFAGGCFWCMEEPFEKHDGVLDVEAGYTGGNTEKPTYEEVCGGKTGHVEAVRIRFDPERIGYADLLEIFWRQVDPTDDSGQFVDRGGQYRPAIFYHDERQRKLAEASRDRLTAASRFSKPVVTPILPAGTFHPAEDYHQDYHRTNKMRYRSYRGSSGRDRFLQDAWGADRAWRPQGCPIRTATEEKKATGSTAPDKTLSTGTGTAGKAGDRAETQTMKAMPRTGEPRTGKTGAEVMKTETAGTSAAGNSTTAEVLSQRPAQKETSAKATIPGLPDSTDIGTAYRRPSNEELRRRLTPEQYRVTRENDTEPPFANAYWNHREVGIYVDVISGEPLFSSHDKFDSGTGWPSFTRLLAPGNIVERRDRGLLMVRTEVRSRHADSHLGHVFDDGPPPTGKRYCINSAALRFIPADRLAEEGYGSYAPRFAK